MQTMVTKHSFAAALFSALLLLGISPGVSSAQPFEEIVKAASPLGTTHAMESLFWSQKADCNKNKSDFLKRQCQGVERIRKAKVSQESYLASLDHQAVSVAVNEKMLSVEVSLHACIACEKEGIIVVGKGAHQLTAEGIVAAKVVSKKKSFKKLAEAKRWAQYVAGRMRGQLIVRIPNSADRFKAAGRSGYKVDVLGYRLYDPCQGDVFAASKKSGQGPVDAETCKGEPATESDTAAAQESKAIVKRLSPQQIKTTMGLVTKEFKKCHQAYGIDGKMVFKLVIAADGSLKKAVQKGDFNGTPTGICIDKAMAAVQFPKSKRKITKISYPVTLR